jgi:hypothetical protein
MSVEDLTNKLAQYFSWLYFERQWAQWELLALAITALVLLLLIAKRRRKRAAKKKYANRVREQSPIIGIGLAERSGIKNRKFRWKECLLAVLILFVSIFVLSQWMLDQAGTWTEKPTKKVISGIVRQAKALFHREETINIQPTVLFRRQETTNTKFELFYQKYKNKYALLPVSGVYVELLSFNPKDESGPSRQGYEDPGHSLPDWAVGEYGAIPPRRILQILGPDEMLVVGFVSEGGRVVHFKGWPTKGLVKGQPWPFDPHGPDPNQEKEPTEVAVVGTYKYRTILEAVATVPSAVPLILFRKGLTMEQFKDLLLSKEQLPEDLQHFKSELLADEAKPSDNSRPVRAQPKLSDSLGTRRPARGSPKSAPAES